MSTAGAPVPVTSSYSSSIQPMTVSSVPTSGAGTSMRGPSTRAIARIQALETLSSSARDSERGSTATPPFPPPKGRPITAHLIVIQSARASTSARWTPGWNRTPPLAGPSASL